MSKANRSDHLGEIRGDGLYPIATFAERLGLGDWAMKSLRQKGLPTIRTCGRTFIDGESALEFFRGLGNGREASER